MKFLLVLLALAAPFLFPYPATLFVAFLASLYFPGAALLSGALAELLYYAPGVGVPVALIAGGALSFIALIIRRFARGHFYAGA